MTCKNCNKEFEGDFCPSCGQKFIPSFTWSYLWEVTLSSLEMNRGFLHNVRDLTIRPAEMMFGYLNGKTKYYLNPFSYLIFVLAIVSLLDAAMDALNIYGAEGNFMSEINEDKMYYQYVMIACFLVLGFFLSFKISLRRSGLESLILSVFTSAHFILISVFISALIFRLDDWAWITGNLCLILYMLWFLYKMYGSQWFTFIWKTSVTIIFVSSFFLGTLYLYPTLRPRESDVDYIKIKEKEAMAISQLQKNKDFALSLSDQNHIRLHNETESIVNELGSLAEHLINTTGGVIDGGGFTGSAQEMERDRIEDFESTITEEKLLKALEACGCEYSAKSFYDPQKVVGENLLDALSYLYSQQLFILLAERECITTGMDF